MPQHSSGSPLRQCASIAARMSLGISSGAVLSSASPPGSSIATDTPGALDRWQMTRHRSDLSRLLVSLGEKRSREITLAEIWQHDDEELASVLGSAGDLDRARDGGAGGDAAQDPLFAREPARHLERLVVTHGNDLVDDLDVQVLGDEPRAEALKLVRAGLQGLAPAGLTDHRRADWLEGDNVHARFAALQDLTAAGDGAAGPDAGNQDVNLPVGVAPDLLGGRL